MIETPQTILMVDSDAVCREQNARLLRKRGFRVLEAKGYRDAENIWQRHPGQVSLLVTAIALPERNGYELAGRLCASEPGIKVLFISGATGAVISEFHERRIEGAQTLFRPFEGVKLLKKVTDLLKSDRVRAAEQG